MSVNSQCFAWDRHMWSDIKLRKTSHYNPHAVCVFFFAIAYSSEHMTDGFVSIEDAQMFFDATENDLQVLDQQGFITLIDDGFIINRLDDFNPCSTSSKHNQDTYTVTIPNKAMHDTRLTSNAKLLYGYLVAHFMQQDCTMTTKQLARETHLSEQSVTRLLRLLRECGYISVSLQRVDETSFTLERHITVEK